MRVHTRLRKPPSVYGLLAIGLILVIEPALPQHHLSPFWFSLGVFGMAVGLYDLIRAQR